MMVSQYDGVQTTNLVITTLFGLSALVATCARVVSRRLQGLTLNSSDYVMILALAFALGGVIVNYVGVVDGRLGQQQDILTHHQYAVYEQTLFAVQLLWAAAEGSIKSSMCLLYMQLFPTRGFRQLAWVVLVFCILFAFTVIFGTIFICEPVASQYNPDVVGHCGNRVGMWIAIGVLNIVTDLSVLVLPVLKLYGLTLKTSKKIGLVIIFSLGVFVCVVSGVRLKYLLAVNFGPGGDPVYEIGTLNIWSLLEPTTAITIGCVPTLGPLYNKIRGRPVGRAPRRQVEGYSAGGFSSRKHRHVDESMFSRLSDEGNYPLTEAGVSIGSTSSSSKLAHGQVFPADRIGVTRQIDVVWQGQDEKV